MPVLGSPLAPGRRTLSIEFAYTQKTVDIALAIALEASPAKKPYTLVHRDGITVETPHADTESQRYRHRRSAAGRAKILDQLDCINTTPKGKLRFMQCGQKAQIQFNRDTRQYRVKSYTCGHRWCPACRGAALAALRSRLEDKFEGAKKHELKFITLTIRGNLEPLRNQVTELWRSFRRLRQTTIWTRRVKHGVAILEVTYNNETNLWHPHIHILAISGFMQRQALSKAWEKASRGSMVSDIREVKTKSTAFAYVLKYATKGGEELESDSDNPKAAELINGLKRLKTIQWFGRNPEPEEEDNDADSIRRGAWIDVCSLAEAIWLKKQGNKIAAKLLLALDDPTTEHPLYHIRGKPP